MSIYLPSWLHVQYYACNSPSVNTIHPKNLHIKGKYTFSSSPERETLTFFSFLHVRKNLWSMRSSLLLFLLLGVLIAPLLSPTYYCHLLEKLHVAGCMSERPAVSSLPGWIGFQRKLIPSENDLLSLPIICSNSWAIIFVRFHVPQEKHIPDRHWTDT